MTKLEILILVLTLYCITGGFAIGFLIGTRVGFKRAIKSLFAILLSTISFTACSTDEPKKSRWDVYKEYERKEMDLRGQAATYSLKAWQYSSLQADSTATATVKAAQRKSDSCEQASKFWSAKMDSIVAEMRKDQYIKDRKELLGK